MPTELGAGPRIASGYGTFNGHRHLPRMRVMLLR